MHHHPTTRRTNRSRRPSPQGRPLPTWVPLDPAQAAEALWLDGLAARRRSGRRGRP